MEKQPAVEPQRVEEFVAQAHGNLQRVTEMLSEQPGLLNAAWDWGGGDWETALGAAAHMGRKDIAALLLQNGARLDLFAAAMLDYADVVRAALEAEPAARYAPGPHGIPLVAHAKAGEAEAVLALLTPSQD